MRLTNGMFPTTRTRSARLDDAFGKPIISPASGSREPASTGADVQLPEYTPAGSHLLLADNISARVERWTSPVADRFAIAAGFAILAISLAFRLLWLDRLP